VVDVLGINGSPRKYGNTYKSLRIALMAVEYEGLDTELTNLVDLDIKPCLGCLCDEQKACRYPCVIDDDMKTLYDKVLKADVLIIATPIYWFSPSSVVKKFIDRLTALENMIFVDGKSWVEGKIAGVIAVGNDSGAISVISNLYATLVSMGFMIPPFAMAYYTGDKDVLQCESAILDAANVGRATVLLAKMLKKERWYVVDEVKEWLKTVMPKIKEELNMNKNKQFTGREPIISKLLR